MNCTNSDRCHGIHGRIVAGRDVFLRIGGMAEEIGGSYGE